MIDHKELDRVKALAFRKGCQLSEASNHSEHPWFSQYHPAFFVLSEFGQPLTTTRDLQSAENFLHFLADWEYVKHEF
jgi:hypothetical protein